MTVQCAGVLHDTETTLDVKTTLRETTVPGLTPTLSFLQDTVDDGSPGEGERESASGRPCRGPQDRT